MNRSGLSRRLPGMSLALLFLMGVLPCFAGDRPQASQADGETIVMLRHGEKPTGGLGQLSCRGLNRSLALPSILIGRYGKPDFIYAPDPGVKIKDGNPQPAYSYVRPLATIEPTAIFLGMPVNTQIGFDQIDALEQELLQPAYAHSLIFVAWEHVMLHNLAGQMLQTYGVSSPQLPSWPGDDYDTIYVFHIRRSGKNNTPQVTLDLQKEDLDGTLKDSCPSSQ